MKDQAGKTYAAGAIETWLASRSDSGFNRHTAILLLLPGLTPAVMSRLLSRSAATVLTWRRKASRVHAADPSIAAEVHQLTTGMSFSDGLWLAQNRGKGPLSFWSRLAIKTMRAEGRTYDELASMFLIHPKTAQNVCHGRFSVGFNPLSGVRCPTVHQSAPPGRWR
jgi:hypothetical protein